MATATTLGPHFPDQRQHPAAKLATTLRVAAATTLVLGTGLQAASWLVYAQPNLTAAYTSVAAGAVRPDLSLALNVLATPFWIGGIAVYVLLGRSRSPRLAWMGGTLLVAGFTALASNLGSEIRTSCRVRETIISPAQADLATRTLSSQPATVMNLLFLVGILLGIPLTAASLWRSGAVPRTTAALLVAFLAIDLAGQSTSIPALGITAHVIGLIAASWIATAILRTPPIRCRPSRRNRGKTATTSTTT